MITKMTMEKLLKALNEYDNDCLSVWISREFTKRLLNNHKIDLDKLNKALDEDVYINNELAGTNTKLIMLLSTKENPMLYLSSLIK